MLRGESALSYARRIRADGERTRAGACAARQRSELLRTAVARAVTRATQLAGRAPYSRVVGTRTGTAVRYLVRRDGTVQGETGSRSQDPLKATVAAAQSCDHVASIHFRRAGWRPGIPSVQAAAHLDGVDHRDLDLWAQELREAIADGLNEKVVRLLFDAGLVATALLSRATDDVTRDQLSHIVATLDEAVAEVRAIIFPLRPHDSGNGSSPAAQDRPSGSVEEVPRDLWP